MNTTLENLTEKVRENRLRSLAKNIVQYQNFSTSSIISKIDDAGLSYYTLKNYIDYGISYIKTGKVNRNISSIIGYIDENIKNCIQPLTPKNEEKRGFKKQSKTIIKKDTVLPVQNVLKNIVTKNINKSIAIKIDNNIVLLTSEEEANGFIKGINFMDKNIKCNLINISYEVI